MALNSKFLGGDQIWYNGATDIFKIDHDGNMVVYDDIELYFGDSNDASIYFDASDTGHLIIACPYGLQLDRVINIAPSAVGCWINFELETEWTGGTGLIAADFASTTTMTMDAIGTTLDFNTSMTMTTDYDVIGYQIKLPTFTQSAANTTVITGFNLPTAGALVNTNGVITWNGLNIQLPAITQTSGTIVGSGIYITGAAITTGGTLNGIYMTGTYTNAISISNTLGILGGTIIIDTDAPLATVTHGWTAAEKITIDQTSAISGAWNATGRLMVIHSTVTFNNNITNVFGVFSKITDAAATASKTVNDVQAVVGMVDLLTTAAGTVTQQTTSMICGLKGIIANTSTSCTWGGGCAVLALEFGPNTTFTQGSYLMNAWNHAGTTMDA